MPRVHHVKKARRALPDHGIEVGDEYYWWAFRLGRSSIKRYSKTYPKRQQLTMSDFLSQVYEIEDRIQALTPGETLEDEVSEIVDEIRALGDEQQEKLDNMPDSLQLGPTGELLQGRVDSCTDWADMLEGVTIPDWDAENIEERDEVFSDAIDELQSYTYEGE